jgi:soluble epoxide hydrolase/lipid-phosphate phosphatase
MYVKAYKTSGFRGGLNWYRNVEENWKWSCTVRIFYRIFFLKFIQVAGKKVPQPTIIVTVGKDPLFPPESAKISEPFLPNLTKAHIPQSGHWIMQEAPEELNSILIKWLKTAHNQNSKL